MEIELAKYVQAGDVAAVKQALSTGISVEATDSMENSLLIVAAQNDHLELVELLLSAGADPNARGWGGTTALMECGSLSIMEALIAAGSDPFTENDDCEDLQSQYAQSEASLKALQEALEAGQLPGNEGQMYWPASADFVARKHLIEKLFKNRRI
ncbi:MAG: ankyrin repeat domain-containing protein [Synechococcus sp.]